MSLLLRLSPARLVRACGLPPRRAACAARRFASAESAADAAAAASASAPSAPAFAALAATVTAAVDAGEAELRARFGGPGAEKRWMLSYYKHARAPLLLPALRALLADGRVAALPSLASKTVLFAGAVLRGAPPDVARAAVAGLPFVVRDQALLAAVLRAAGTPPAAELLQRLAAGARRAGDAALVAAVQHVGAVPQALPEDWAPPAAAAGLAADWQRLVQPCELAPVWRQVKDAVTFQQYLLLAGTTHLECLWASFYATGRREPLRAILGLAAHWAEFAPQLPDAVEFLADIARPLPAALTADAADEPGQRRAARAQVARAACWSLLHNARRHERVTAALCDAVADLAPHMVDRSDETAGEAGYSGAADDAGAGATAAGADAGAPLSAAELHQLEVFPPLLHLLGRMVVDSQKEAAVALK